MINNGKPRITPIQLKDGFYVEVFDKEHAKGMKIRCETRQAMQATAAMYNSYKDVVILGEYQNGVPVPEKKTGA